MRVGRHSTVRVACRLFLCLPLTATECSIPTCDVASGKVTFLDHDDYSKIKTLGSFPQRELRKHRAVQSGSGGSPTRAGRGPLAAEFGSDVVKGRYLAAA